MLTSFCDVFCFAVFVYGKEAKSRVKQDTLFLIKTKQTNKFKIRTPHLVQTLGKTR